MKYIFAILVTEKQVCINSQVNPLYKYIFLQYQAYAIVESPDEYCDDDMIFNLFCYVFLEGQRKAIFEISEAERKANADEIIRLKKEIGELVVSLKENRCDVFGDRALTKRIQSIIGPIDKKTSEEVKELIDLQIVDKSKQLNLLRYRIKQVDLFSTLLNYLLSV